MVFVSMQFLQDQSVHLAAFEKTAALRRTVTIDDVGNSAAFLCSDLASGITGEIVHVDAGFSVMAMGELGEE